jgi:hypothetical protein
MREGYPLATRGGGPDKQKARRRETGLGDLKPKAARPRQIRAPGGEGGVPRLAALRVLCGSRPATELAFWRKHPSQLIFA